MMREAATTEEDARSRSLHGCGGFSERGESSAEGMAGAGYPVAQGPDFDGEQGRCKAPCLQVT